MHQIILITIFLGFNNALEPVDYLERYGYMDKSADAGTTISVDISPAVRKMQVDYLQRYGYLETDHGSDDSGKTLFDMDISPAVRKMQETLGLPVTGDVDDATRQLMEKDRCGVKDIHITRHRRRARRSIASHVTYKVESNDLSPVVKIATETWTKATGIVFHQIDGDADIFIAWKAPIHEMNEKNHSFGEKDYAHATRPVFTDKNFRRIGEIHINLDKTLHSDIVHSTYEKTSLIAVMVHEIGHMLGLDHSNDTSSVMYPIMQPRQVPITETDVKQIDIDWESPVTPPRSPRRPSITKNSNTPVTCSAPVTCPAPVKCPAPVTIPPERCPDGWYHDKKGKCYKTVLLKYTFDAATEWCREAAPGGMLASIHSDRELDLVQGLISIAFAGSDLRYTWIGLRRINGVYTWPDQTEFDYKPYNITYNFRNSFECVMTDYDRKNRTWLWFVQPCDKVWPFICEAPSEY